MTDKNFMRVEDVARELDVSKSYAYKIVQKLNKELEAKGYITISGRVNRQYFLEPRAIFITKWTEGRKNQA